MSWNVYFFAFILQFLSTFSTRFNDMLQIFKMIDLGKGCNINVMQIEVGEKKTLNIFQMLTHHNFVYS
jgi:hypothetical protein